MAKAWNSTLNAPKKQLRRTPFKAKVSLRTRPTYMTQKGATSAKTGIKQAKQPKPKVWTTATADTHFSRFIRTRDPVCRKCRYKPTSDCSHFWGRGHSATRFDPKNCVGLCRFCHDTWEHQKNYEYKEFMISWLGQEEYDLLERRARGFKKRSEAVAECKVLLGKL